MKRWILIGGICLGTLLVQAAPLQVDIFPLKFLKGNYSICANVPGTLVLNSQGERLKAPLPTAELRFELPPFLRLLSVESVLPDRQTGMVIAYPISPTPDAPHTYTVKMDQRFVQRLGYPWDSQVIRLAAQADSVGKIGKMQIALYLNGRQTSLHTATCRVLPPVVLPPRPAQNFKLHLTSPAQYPGHIDFWSRLARQRLLLEPHLPARDLAGRNLNNGFEQTLMLSGADLMCGIPEARAALLKLRRDWGEKSTLPDYRMLEDVDKKFEQYQRFLWRTIIRKKPHLKMISWDYEPGARDYSLGTRTRFARKMKLREVPAAVTIKQKYASAWFDYTVDLHSQLIRQVYRIFKEELPQVKLYLCTDPLHAGAERLAQWCAVDAAAVDAAVDGYLSMPYYCGARYFDDVKFNIAQLKKPFFPLIDPAERLLSFVQQYTPDRVGQNILATAALGGEGIGFWPEEAFTGEFFASIARAMSLIARYENFYQKPPLQTAQFRLTPVNTAVYQIPDEYGQKVELRYPDFSSYIRYTIHQHRGCYLFTIFNYHETQAVIVEIAGPQIRYLFAVPPNGMAATTSDNPPEQKALQAALKLSRARQAQSTLFKPLNDAQSSIYFQSVQGQPRLFLTNANLKLQLNFLGSGEVISFKNREQAELLDGGFIGRFTLMDNRQKKLDFKMLPAQLGMVSCQATVAPFDGANPEINPLLNLKIRRDFILHDHQLEVKVTLTNPGEKPMNVEFRISNMPHLGKRFKATHSTLSLGELRAVDTLFWKKGQVGNFLAGRRVPRFAWDGQPIVVKAQNDGLQDVLTFVPEARFAGVYCWKHKSLFTLEFLSPQLTLQPGESQSFSYFVR